MMYYLMKSDFEISAGIVIVAIILGAFMIAFTYCSIKLIKKKKIKYILLGILGFGGTILSIIGALIMLIYSTYGDKYTFRIVNVLKVDSDKIYVRHKDQGEDEYHYYELNKPFYATVKEDDDALVRFKNDGLSEPKYFEYYYSPQFGGEMYSIGFMITISIGVYYIYIKSKEKKGCDFNAE